MKLTIKSSETTNQSKEMVNINSKYLNIDNMLRISVEPSPFEKEATIITIDCPSNGLRVFKRYENVSEKEMDVIRKQLVATIKKHIDGIEKDVKDFTKKYKFKKLD